MGKRCAIRRRLQIDPEESSIYVQLYRLNSQTVSGDEDPTEVFISSPELKRYVREKNVGLGDVSGHFVCRPFLGAGQDGAIAEKPA